MASWRSPMQLVEVMHLAFLRALETKLDRAAYVVNGGVKKRQKPGSGCASWSSTSS